MEENRNTHDIDDLQKMRSFYSNQKNSDVINSCGIYLTPLWVDIFKHFFGKVPTGNHDPLWDTLLHKKSGFKLQARVLEEAYIQKAKAA